MNILLIDDTPEDRERIFRALQHCAANISVDTAESGKKALSKVCENTGETFDVILIDRYLPDMLGTDLADQMRFMGCARNAALIMVTGDSGDTARSDALARNFDGFMTKPVDQVRLRSMIMEKKIFWEISDLPNDLDLYRSKLAAVG